MVDHGVFSSKDGKLLKGNYHMKKQNHKVLISRYMFILNLFKDF